MDKNPLGNLIKGVLMDKLTVSSSYPFTLIKKTQKKKKKKTKLKP